VNFSELTQAALLGTGRQAIAIAAGESELSRLLAQLDWNRREEALLAAAALSGLHEATGQLPARDTAPAPEPCAGEELPRLSERAGSLLLRLLGGDFPELLPECLRRCAGARQLPFPEALPALLTTGLARAELRADILPVLGRRGRWLAAQNPDWAWAIGATADDETIWHVGGGGARLLFLQRLRRTNPARARELLTSTWKDETPEDRAGFISILETGLTLEDEPFLEAALEDKRKEVRRNAAALLAQTPGSALNQRMTDRVAPLLKFVPGESGKLKKSKSGSVEITLPGECDKAMQRDGVEPRPLTGFGEKIWWLIQMLEMTPLDFWTTKWNAAPAEIVAASLPREWEKEMFEAWTRAAVRQKNAAWAGSLFSIAVHTKQVTKLEGLVGAMSAPQRELLFTPLIDADDGQAGEIQGALVHCCRHEWSPEFSRTVLKWLRKITARQSSDWQLRGQFKGFATRLAVPALHEAGSGWPTDATGWEFWSKGVDELLALAQFRSDLHAAFPSSNPSTHHPI
jgi:hypothetical protein